MNSIQNNKDSAEQVCKYSTKQLSMKNYKLEWSQLNTTEEGELLL